MSSSQELYNRLSETVSALVKVTNRKQLANWLWIVVGLLQGKSPALSQIANFLPMNTQAESRVTLIRRWLMNWHVDVWAFYEPILKHVLQGWSAVQAYVILDGVMIFGERWQIFRVSLQHGCRAIPLAWVVVPGKGLTTVQHLKTMLERVKRLLHNRVKSVVFLADRGFRDCDWAQLCLDLGWNYAIRVACNTYITLEDGRTGRIDAWVSPYRNRYFQNVWLTQAQKLLTNLSVTWTTDKNGQPEMVAVISNQIACRTRLREYGCRMSIEQSFRDDKSGGFNMAHIQLQHADRIERLLLAIAIATLWCHELGEHVLQQGETTRRLIDPGPTRELSLFQLGLRWLKRALAVAMHLLPHFKARLSHLKLQPVLSPLAQIGNL
ncbi:MAG: transposase [Chloroflexi bacterium]|nr:transposase [Chloroflexota bacterium]